MATATASPPVVPPRPSRSSEDKASVPMVPPRPANKRVQRSVTPNPERFAPSPLNEAIFLKSPGSQPAQNAGPAAHHDISGELPSVGEEGKEYANLAEELTSPDEEGPEQTRTVADDLKLHAPKPSLPASSAKQRITAVTRTDSERAASFGIGRPSSTEDSTTAGPSNRSLRRKASTASQVSTAGSQVDEEHGIPEIGLQVPMYKNAGDVQAPSPAPAGAEGAKGKHHVRKTSARGNLPPGSYGLHGHGVAPQDKLEKAYFNKHPELLKKEQLQHHYDRPNDFSMSRDGLDQIVRETASRGAGLAAKNYAGTPSDQVGWQALEESASRIASPSVLSPELKPAAIHIDEPNRRRSVMFSDTESVNGDEIERSYTAPILADDEVAKNPSRSAHQPAVEPPAFDLEGSTSRPTSRPASLHKGDSFELRSTPLEDVEEYEPLFNDEEKKEEEKKEAAKPPTTEKKDKKKNGQRFPSADVWEDAPSSAYYTTEVSTPDLFDEQEKPSPPGGPVPRDGETAAQAFARHQEELAETESHGPRSKAQKPVWAQHQKHVTGSDKSLARPPMQPRFPSRDVWEDAPDSLQLETTVSSPQQDDAAPPSPADALKPDIPERPQPKPKPAEETNNKPAVPDRPKSKPAIPARPSAKLTSTPPTDTTTAAPPAVPRQKPAVPARPMGSKIAALQAGFMSDLNRRLQLGPQAPPSHREEHEDKAEEEAEREKEKEKEKVPLVDARKGRARGPARRAPAAAAGKVAVVGEGVKAEGRGFGVVRAVRFFEVDPEDEGGVLRAGSVAGGVVAAAAAAAGVSGGEAEDGGITSNGEKVEKEERGGEVSATVPAVPAVEEGSGTVIFEGANKDKDNKDNKDEEDAHREEEAPREATPVPGSWPEPQPKLQPEPQSEAQPEPQSEPQPEPQEPKTLATNMAGEPLLVKEGTEKDEEVVEEPLVKAGEA